MVHGRENKRWVLLIHVNEQGAGRKQAIGTRASEETQWAARVTLIL